MVLGTTDVSCFSLPTVPLMDLGLEISKRGPASSPHSLDCSLETSFPQPPPSLGAAKTSYSWMLLLCGALAVAAPPPRCHSLSQGPAKFPPPHLMVHLAGFSAHLGVLSLVPSQVVFPLLLGRDAHGASATTNLPPDSFSLPGPPSRVYLLEHCQALLTLFFSTKPLLASLKSQWRALSPSRWLWIP